jgi:hypothetical protein
MKNHPPAGDKGPHRDLDRERNWRDLLIRFAGSGQTVRAFCAARRLKETAFYFWRSEIRRRDGLGSAPGQPARPTAERPVSFAQVLVQPPQRPQTEEGPRLVLGHGRQLLLPASMPVEQVARLLRAIEGAA